MDNRKEVFKMENRHSIKCPECNIEMVFMKTRPIETINEFFAYAWFRCPSRKKEGEKGCGKESYEQLPVAVKQYL